MAPAASTARPLSKARLDTLPPEVLACIAKACMTYKDIASLKALRLVCKAFLEPTARSLFKSLYIRDLQQFETMMASLHTKRTIDTADHPSLRSDLMVIAESVTIAFRLNERFRSIIDASFNSILAQTSADGASPLIFPRARMVTFGDLPASVDVNWERPLDCSTVLDKLFRPRMVVRLARSNHSEVRRDRYNDRDREQDELLKVYMESTWRSIQTDNSDDKLTLIFHQVDTYRMDETLRGIKAWKGIRTIDIPLTPRPICSPEYPPEGRSIIRFYPNTEIGGPPDAFHLETSVRILIEGLLTHLNPGTDRPESINANIQLLRVSSVQAEMFRERAIQNVKSRTVYRQNGCIEKSVREGSDGWIVKQKIAERKGDVCKGIKVVGLNEGFEGSRVPYAERRPQRCSR